MGTVLCAWLTASLGARAESHEIGSGIRSVGVVAVDRELKEGREKPNDAKLALLRQAVTDNPDERTKRFDLVRGLMATGDMRRRCIGTPSGAFAIAETGGWQKLALGGLPSNDVTAILRDGDRRWAATYDRGVAVLEAGAWQSVGAGLVDARVNAMAT